MQISSAFMRARYELLAVVSSLLGVLNTTLVISLVFATCHVSNQFDLFVDLTFPVVCALFV